MNSLEIIDSKEILRSDTLENKYRNCCFLMTNITIKDNICYGNLYAVSHDDTTYDKLLKYERDFINKGIDSMVIGEYTSLLIDSIDILSIERVNNG